MYGALQCQRVASRVLHEQSTYKTPYLHDDAEDRLMLEGKVGGTRKRTQLSLDIGPTKRDRPIQSRSKSKMSAPQNTQTWRRTIRPLYGRALRRLGAVSA